MSRVVASAPHANDRGDPPLVCFVTANTFQFDSRTQRAATALADAGMRVIVVAQPGAGLPEAETLPGPIRVVRPRVARPLVDALSPLPRPVRRWFGRLGGIGPTDERAPGLPDAAGAPGGPRRRGTARRAIGRAIEILAYRRRIGPWIDAVLAAAPDAAVFSAKALVALPVVRAAAEATGGRYVYDIADLHVDSGRLAGAPRPLKWLVRRRERRLVKHAAALTAASAPLAEAFASVADGRRAVVVHNVRPRWRPDDADPRDGRLIAAAAAAGIAQQNGLVLYQGAFRPEQGIETLLDALAKPALTQLAIGAVFLGFGPLEQQIREAAAARPGRIAVLEAVPSAELLDWTVGADLAFVGAPPVTVNQTLTIPNKLFESLMAGVPVVVAEGTAMATLVAEHDVGAVVSPWTASALATSIAMLMAEDPTARAARRRRARGLALTRFAWEVERDSLVAAYRGALSSAASGEGGSP